MNRDTYRIGLSDEIPKPSRHGRLQVGEVSPEGPDPSVRLHELKKGYKVQMLACFCGRVNAGFSPGDWVQFP